jgi:copper oxidase (laccase) domain-containing protein
MIPVYKFPLPRGIFKVYDKKPDLKIIEVHQTHSPDILIYEGKDLSHEKADGIYFKFDQIRNSSIIIKTADCLPILFLGEDSGVFLHAGWRGLHLKILSHKLIEQCAPYYAFIGPSIRRDQFEVTEEFRQYFNIKNYLEKNGKIYFDLQQEAKDQIESKFPNIQVNDCGICTYKDPALFSYRRLKEACRNYNAFEL